MYFRNCSRNVKKNTENNNNMIIFLTLVGALPSRQAQPSLLGWLINKIVQRSFIPLRRFTSFAYFLHFLLFSVFRRFIRVVMHFYAVIISHFIVYLYRGARTLYFISRKICDSCVFVVDMTFFYTFSSGYLKIPMHTIHKKMYLNLTYQLSILYKI